MQDGLERVLDYSDYAALPDDGKRYEILRGKLLVTPAPRPLHQRVLVRLATRLRHHFSDRRAEVFVAPIDLILTRHDVLQPDLLVVDDVSCITDRGIERPPLLVVEILSRTTARSDRGAKAQRYAELGIRHYWLVDPDARRIECYRLAAGAYERIADVRDHAALSLDDFPELELSLAPLWAPSEAAARTQR